MKFQNPIFNFKLVFDISSFLWQNLQRAITQKNKMIFLNFHQVIYSLSSISYKFEAPSCNDFWDQVFYVQICKGHELKKNIFFLIFTR